MFRIGRKSHIVCGMEIRGNNKFQRRTGAALSLLNALPEFEIICTHLAVLRQGRRSGVKAWAERPIFTVGTPTWSHSSIWYAGTIAHDAFHAKLYRDAKKRNPETDPDADIWSGKAAERACLTFQRQVLLTLQADKTVIDHVDKHAQDPTYQGRSKGWGGWLDYRKRWW